MHLDQGSKIRLTTDESFKDRCSKDVLWIDYKNLINDVQPGKRIFIDDGLISVVATEVGNDETISAQCFIKSVKEIRLNIRAKHKNDATYSHGN